MTPSSKGTALGLKVAFGLKQPPRPLTAAEQELVQYMRWSVAGIVLCVAGLVLVFVAGPIVGGLIAFVGAGCMVVGTRKARRFAKSRRIGDGADS